jgi:hypothetical protein
MTTDKPLNVAVCGRCGTKFFVSDPRPGPYGGEIRIHENAPPGGKDREIVPVKCLACAHPQFVEFWYGR